MLISILNLFLHHILYNKSNNSFRAILLKNSFKWVSKIRATTEKRAVHRRPESNYYGRHDESVFILIHKCSYLASSLAVFLAHSTDLETLLLFKNFFRSLKTTHLELLK